MGSSASVWGFSDAIFLARYTWATYAEGFIKEAQIAARLRYGVESELPRGRNRLTEATGESLFAPPHPP
jgi:hypothetical protein